MFYKLFSVLCLIYLQTSSGWTDTSCSSPIDIVYTWVDGNDPQWKRIKEYYHAELHQDAVPISDATTHNRFADNDELRYSLRSLWQYANFFHHIYIITMDQRPKWLADHSKITVIDHRCIFENQQHLPTFNSQAIESNLHRIPNLSEHFIYFNDDVFLGRPVTPDDFFTEDGKIKVLFEPSLSPTGPPTGNETCYRVAWRNTNAFLDAYFTCERRYRLCHAPFALRKSYMQESEWAFPMVFLANSSHKFRCTDDYNITNGFLQYHWLYQGRVIMGTMKNRMMTLRDRVNDTQSTLNKLKELRPHTFCLQDNLTEDGEETRALLHQFLEEWYPTPAPWEKAANE